MRLSLVCFFLWITKFLKKRKFKSLNNQFLKKRNAGSTLFNVRVGRGTTEFREIVSWKVYLYSWKNDVLVFFYSLKCTVQLSEASVDGCMMLVMHACGGALFDVKDFAEMSSMLRNKQPAQHLALDVQCSCEYHSMPCGNSEFSLELFPHACTDSCQWAQCFLWVLSKHRSTFPCRWTREGEEYKKAQQQPEEDE